MPRLEKQVGTSLDERGCRRDPVGNPWHYPRSVLLTAGTRLFRIHWTEFEAIHFGRSGSGRFDIPDRDAVCYVAHALDGAFVETLGRGEPADVGLLKSRAVTTLVVERQLRFVQFHGAGLISMGATAEVTHTADYHLPRHGLLPFSTTPTDLTALHIGSAMTTTRSAMPCSGVPVGYETVATQQRYGITRIATDCSTSTRSSSMASAESDQGPCSLTSRQT